MGSHWRALSGQLALKNVRSPYLFLGICSPSAGMPHLNIEEGLTMPTTNTVDKPQEIYQIKVTLLGPDPPIWRRLLVPADLTLAFCKPANVDDALRLDFPLSGSLHNTSWSPLLGLRLRAPSLSSCLAAAMIACCASFTSRIRT